MDLLLEVDEGEVGNIFQQLLEVPFSYFHLFHVDVDVVVIVVVQCAETVDVVHVAKVVDTTGVAVARVLGPNIFPDARGRQFALDALEITSLCHEGEIE